MSANTKASAPKRISALRRKKEGSSEPKLATDLHAHKEALANEIISLVARIHARWACKMDRQDTIVLAAEIPRHQRPAKSWLQKLFPSIYEPAPTALAQSMAAYPIGTIKLPKKRWPFRMWIDIDSTRAYCQLSMFTPREMTRADLIELSIEDLSVIRNYLADYHSGSHVVY